MRVKTLTPRASAVVILISISIFLFLLSTSVVFADYKIKQRRTIQGQKIESTVYVKNSRQRTESSGMMGMGAEVATIEQCDLKRNVLVNDNKKLYFIEPFADSSATDTNADSAFRNAPTVTTKGGTVTMTYSIVDTGERKQMFGLTARHLKTSIAMKASPDACSKGDMRMETDGWHVDLPQFSCPIQPPKTPMMRGRRGGGCQDRFVTKQTGSGKLGFPLIETTTMSGIGDSETTFTQSLETLEFSTSALDERLFEVPKNYALAKSSQDLYNAPDMNAIMKNLGDREKEPTTTSSDNVSAVAAKRAGTNRVGVLAITNSSGQPVSTESLRENLIADLTSGSVEAVPVSSTDDAKAKSCDFVLSVDVSQLKQSAANKIGGIFGKAAGIDLSATQKFDVQIAYKLTTPDGQTKAQNKTAQKTNGEAATAAARAVLSLTASAILSAIQK
jgi:hypothetical protein